MVRNTVETDDKTEKTFAEFKSGILSDAQIKQLIKLKVISPGSKLDKNQIQPASIDLRLGKKVWRVQASFLPGEDVSVEDKLKGMHSKTIFDSVPVMNELAMHEFEITNGAVLEKGCVYIAEISESLKLPTNLNCFANPKSSTGRLDVFTRMITNGASEFETAKQGYNGSIFAEISPRTFSVLVRSGSRLSQLRFRKGQPKISDEEMKNLQREVGLIQGDRLDVYDIRDGVPLSVDLSGEADPRMPGLIGWRARKNSNVIDIDRPRAYPVSQFWEPITRRDLSAGGLILNPDEFYILASREYVRVPQGYAAEMTPYDIKVGEFRAHYAGFFDPGFGMPDQGAGKTRAVLEVRAHDVPFLIEEGRAICRLVYEPMSESPIVVYGQGHIGSNYQAQGLQLAKHFLPPEETGNG